MLKGGYVGRLLTPSARKGDTVTVRGYNHPLTAQHIKFGNTYDVTGIYLEYLDCIYE
jgi:hypothetical protein